MVHMRQVALVIMIVVGAKGVPIVDVADVVVVLDRRMSASRSVLVGVIFMEAVLGGTLASRSQAFETPNPDQSQFYTSSSSPLRMTSTPRGPTVAK